MVFYRKYRPQTIDELDSVKVRETLRSVLLSEDIPHAFLFTGPKGLGKTSTARILAKVVNCTTRKQGEYNPCNQCDACISITSGTNIDVLEIDGASNRGIDEIRDLREKVRLSPSSLKKKVYIIDEVHMLTTEAFNALLKTIEEPPSHVMFLFCTTEPQKVPATILSRCFHVSFLRATEEELKRSLERIVLSENIHITDDSYGLIANLADGGFRDAAKILEEINLLGEGKKITKEFIEKKYHITDLEQHAGYMVEFLSKKDTKSALLLIKTITEQGVDMRYFISKVLHILHETLLVIVGVEKNSKFKIQSLKLSIEDITYLVSLLSKAYTDTKYTIIPQLPLEIAIISFTFQESGAVPTLITEQSVDGKPTINGLRKHQQTLKVQSILNPVKPEAKKVQEEDTHEQRPIPANHDNNTSILENLIYKTKPYNHSVAAVLRGSKIKLFDGNALILETAYKFHKERLDENNTRELMEKVLKEITGKAVKITVELRK